MTSVRTPEDSPSTLLELARDPTLIVRHFDRRILAANAAAARVYGHPLDALCRMRLSDLVADPAHLDELFTLRRHQVSQRFHLRSDGSRFPAEMSVLWRIGPDGTEQGYFCVRDLGPAEDQARRERGLEALNRALFREAGRPMLLLDRRGIVSEANTAAQALYGYPATTLIGLPMSRLLQDGTQVRQYFRHRQSLHTGQRHCRQDGTTFLAEVTLTLTGLSSEFHAVVIVRDITEEQALLERLRLSEARWRFALEGQGDVLWEWDLAHEQMQVSRHLGDPPDAPTAGEQPLSYWAERVHPDDLPPLQAAITAHLKGETPQIDLELRMYTHRHGLRWVWMRGRVMDYAPGGAPLRLLGSVRDIHEQRQQAEELTVWREQMLHTARLTSLGEMAATLAHELNQPLTSMRTFSAAAVLRLDQPELRDLEEIRRLIGLVSEESMRAGRILQHIRSFVRKGQVHFELLSLNDLVMNVQRLVEQRTRRQGIRTRLELAGDLPMLRADRVLMEQLLMNLMLNAADALRDQPGEQVITIRTHQAAPPGHLGLELHDSGPGLPEALRHNLFAPFFTTKPDGLGLGLTICRSIIEAHQGQISAENPPEGGALFRVLLPLAAAASPSASSDASLAR